MLRIAKFKLSEVQRNIKHNQLKPMQKEEKNSPRVGAGGGVVVSDPAEENKARLAAIEKAKKLKEQRKKEEQKQVIMFSYVQCLCLSIIYVHCLF